MKYISTLLFIICLEFILRTSIKRKWLHTEKTRSRRYPTESIRNCLALLTNAHAKAESQLYSLEQTVRSIGLYVNTNKIEFVCFKQKGPLKSVGQFTYLGSNISSTENDANIQLAKMWTDYWSNWNRISEKNKRDFFQGMAVAVLLYRCITSTLTYGEKVWCELCKNVNYTRMWTMQECCVLFSRIPRSSIPQNSDLFPIYQNIQVRRARQRLMQKTADWLTMMNLISLPQRHSFMEEKLCCLPDGIIVV